MSSILVVDDEKSINDIIVKNLKLVGHTCEQAFDGTTALNFSDGKRIRPADSGYHASGYERL